jgi:DNA-binding transcriptional MerR regulator
MARKRLQAVPSAEPPDEAQLTIEQLAHETGMTVRNIRNHQSRGLLPPPVVRMRVGYYGPEHVTRLQLVQEMQADGFNLGSIKRLIGDSHGAAEGLLGFRRAISAPWESEPSEILTADELVERFGTFDGKALGRAERLGLLVEVGGGRYEAPSPALLRAAEEVMSRGVSLDSALTVVEQVKRACESVARAFSKMFLEEVWTPFEKAGHPAERWPEILEAIERLKPLASDALLGVFQLTMTREAEEAFGRRLERQAKRGRKT